MPQSVAAASLDPAPLPSGYAVIGIIGPDSPPHRQALRGWTSLVAPEILVRFAVSLRDRADMNPRWTAYSHAMYEPDVDFIDCLGQRAGAGVVILALFDAWLRHALGHYPHAKFIGRADSDAIPSPQWLLAMLRAEAARQAQDASNATSQQSPTPFVYAGSFQWYNWDEVRFQPLGWGKGAKRARHRAIAQSPARCKQKSSARCAGPFPFAAGPLLLLSSSLTRWYVEQPRISATVSAALDSRLNRTAGGSSSVDLTLEAARARGEFLRLSEPGDLEVRLFDGIFLGHAVCLGRAPSVTILGFPHGVFVDFPCDGSIDGCRNGIARQFNWSLPGAPLLAHRVRKPEAIKIALEHLERAAKSMPPQVASCGPFLTPKSITNVCGADWRWCSTPFNEQVKKPRAPRTVRRSEADSKGVGARWRPLTTLT